MANSSFDVLAKLPGGVPIQSFPLVQGKINKTSGTFVGNLIHCVEDGTIIVCWRDGTEDTITMIAGQDFSFVLTVSFTIQSGTFHFV